MTSDKLNIATSQTKRMLKHSSVYAVGNLSRQLVGFVMLPVYTRYLSPADYGTVGLLIFMVTLIELLFGARMLQAVPKFYYEQQNKGSANSVISTSLLITSAVSLITVIAVITFREPISQLIFGAVGNEILVAMFSVLILTQALENYTLGFIRIQQRPWLFIGASTGKLVLQLSFNIWMVVILELGVMGVAISNVVSSILFTLVMTVYTLWNTGVQFSRNIAMRMLSFSWPLWLSGLAGLYIGSSNRYYIRVFGTLDEVGLFELAAKFGTIITLLVWMPFSQYWQTERFNLYHQPNPVPIYQSVFRFIATMLVLAALGVAIFVGPVVRIMATAEFHPASSAAPYLVFAAVFQCLTFFSNFSFLVKEKTGWMTWNSYITAAIVTVLYLALIPPLGFVGAAQALLCANAVQFTVVHFVAKKHYDMKISLKPLLVYAPIAAGSVILAFHLEQDDLILDIGVKVLIYLIGGTLIGAYFLSNSDIRRTAGKLIAESLPQRSRSQSG